MTNVATTTKKTRLSLHALKGKIQLKGLHAVDGRTAAAKHLVAWRDELVAALGEPSPQKLALVELAVRARALLDHVDAFLLEQPSLINRRAKKLVPLVTQRTQLAEHLAKLLAQVGLERVPKPLPSLQEYLAEKYPEGEEHAQVESDRSRPDDGSGAVRQDV